VVSAASLSNQIRRLRFEHGEMTQQELADLARVTRQTIIALEANKLMMYSGTKSSREDSDV